MQLLYQTHSPYARKALVLAHETGLAARLHVMHQETSPTNRNDLVFALNPLGKVPVLVLDDGATLFDSAVICEYLDGLHEGPRLIPARGPERWRTLRLQALAQGMADAGVALRWETERRPEPVRWPPMARGQADKLLAAYDLIEREAAFDGPLDLGQIALATTLDWLDFRALPDFRQGRPRLTAWFEAFLMRPSMTATTYEGQTRDAA
jgi:glutathione S-transferase